MRTTRLLMFAVVIVPVGLGLVTACGNSQDKKPSTQVAARVNGAEISVHQINFTLSRAGNVPQEQAKAAGQQVLDKLIDQQVLVQKAVEKKLDRDPRVMQTIEAAKQQILSQSYLEQTAAAVSKSAPDDIKAFYAKHPELFEQRRIYRYQQLGAQANADLLPKLEDQVAKAKSLNDVATWLRDQKVPFGAADIVTKPAEQLPLEWVPVFQSLKDGSIKVIKQQPNVLLVTQLINSQEAPMTEKQAAPYIEQYLLNQKRTEVVDKEIKDLRGKAKIEYVGEFAATKKAAAAAQPEAAKPQVAASAQPEKTPNKQFIEKGLSGLN